MRHMNDNPPSLRLWIPSLSPAVEQVVFKALAKDPKLRFVDMDSFSSALEQASQAQRRIGLTANSEIYTTGIFSLATNHRVNSFNTCQHSLPHPQTTIRHSGCGGARGGDYTSITEAINHAEAHTRILVRPGVYVECVTLNKEVEIVGDGPREHIFLENHSAVCLSMETERALVQGSVFEAVVDSAVVIPHGQLSLIDCEISAVRGIYTAGAITIEGKGTNPLIKSCRVSGNDIPAILVLDYAQGTIESCTILAQYSWAMEVGREAIRVSLVVRSPLTLMGSG